MRIVIVSIMKEDGMSRTCQVTGKTPGFGHHVSHSHRRTKRRFDVNVQTKRYWVPTLGRSVRLTVSPKGIKEIDSRGIDAVVARLRREGVRL
jgi:large subunit ribosomal protein L28